MNLLLVDKNISYQAQLKAYLYDSFNPKHTRTFEHGYIVSGLDSRHFISL